MTQIKNRVKRLRKLSRISRELIDDYGLIYFIEIARQELKKQSFSLFDYPGINFSPTKKLDEKIAYKIWLNKITSNTAKAQFNKKINHLKLKPTVLLILLQNDIDALHLKKTIKSIQSQTYENWRLLVFLNSDSKLEGNNVKEITDTRISFKNTNSDINEINRSVLEGEPAEFTGFLESGDVLVPEALFELIRSYNQTPTSDIIYTDQDELTVSGERINPFFKPDWCPYLFLNLNYLQKFCLVKRSLLKKTELIRDGFGDYMVYDLLLRCTERAENIKHVHLPLCSSIEKKNSIEEPEKAKSVVLEAIRRRKIKGTVSEGNLPQTTRIIPDLVDEPLVSVIIPTRDNKRLLKRCIDSIKRKTRYKNWEIIIIDNNSEKKETVSYLKSLPYPVLNYDFPFNFSKIINLGASHAKGEYLLFHNDDIAILDSNWLEELLRFCSLDDVGAVGPKLIHSDNTIQHAGVSFLKNGVGFHPFQHIEHLAEGYHKLPNLARECTAVTGACLLIKKSIFDNVGRFDEMFDVYYGDSDLCLKIWKAGYKVLYVPYTKLLHEGSVSIKRNSEHYIAVENYLDFIRKWPSLLEGDPCYNVNLGWDYQIKVS